MLARAFGIKNCGSLVKFTTSGLVPCMWLNSLFITKLPIPCNWSLDLPLKIYELNHELENVVHLSFKVVQSKQDNKHLGLMSFCE